MMTLGPALLVAVQATTVPVPAGAPQLLVELQHELARAWVVGDRVTLERIIAPDWTTTGPDGILRAREQVLAEVFETHVHRIQQITIRDVDVRVFGEAAVVRGRTHALGEFAGNSYDVQIRFMDVFLMRNGQWQAVASHASVLTDPGKPSEESRGGPTRS